MQCEHTTSHCCSPPRTDKAKPRHGEPRWQFLCPLWRGPKAVVDFIMSVWCYVLDCNVGHNGCGCGVALMLVALDWNVGGTDFWSFFFHSCGFGKGTHNLSLFFGEVQRAREVNGRCESKCNFGVVDCSLASLVVVAISPNKLVLLLRMVNIFTTSCHLLGLLPQKGFQKLFCC